MTVRQYLALATICIAAWTPRLATAQTVAPAPAPAGAPAMIQMGRDWALDAPPTWTIPAVPGTSNAFIPRTDATFMGELQRVGRRPTDLPYILVEQIYPDAGLDSVAGRHEIAERVADYYRTALNPPSKADRSPSWKHSKVSPIRYDATSGLFSFDATITYDTVGDLHVVVSGLFDRERVMIFSGWSDAAFDAEHPGEIAAIRDSMRLIGLTGATLVSPGEYLRTIVQVLVGLFVAAVVVLQIVVWRRDRRARQGEAVQVF